MLTNPIFWIATAIIAVIAVIEDLYVWMNGGESVFGGWMEELGIFLDDMKKMIDEVTSYFSAMWKQIKKDFEEEVSFFTVLFSGDWNKVIGIVKQAFLTFWKDVKTIFLPLVNWFSQKFEEIGNWCEKTFNEACDAVTQFFIQMWEDIKKPFVVAWEWIKSLFTGGHNRNNARDDRKLTGSR